LTVIKKRTFGLLEEFRRRVHLDGSRFEPSGHMIAAAGKPC
jgi:hypothetical protein